LSAITDLLNGIATMSATAGVGVYDPAAVYTTGQTGIFMKVMPATPDRVIVLTAVNQGDSISDPFGQVMVQARFRGLPGQPLDVDVLADSFFDIFHGTTGLVFGSVGAVQMNRKVSVPMGMDDLKRWSRVDQYYLDVAFPPTVNRPPGGSW
jgi:hypothetical protein